MIKINTRKCQSCGTCYDSCKALAIELKTKGAEVNDKCTGCGVCLILCPTKAIEKIISRGLACDDF